jgi:hypothetical protein
MTTPTHDIVREPLTGPAAWRGRDLTPADWCHQLEPAEVDALTALRDDLVERGLGLGDIDPDSVPIPALASSIASWVDRLERGIGFVVVRGLDITGWSVREAGLVYYALGRQLGHPVRQNASGHLIGHVRDTGMDIRDPGTRGYQTRVRLPFHTDTSTDVLGLLCYRTAKSGGMSSLAPLQTIYNEILRQRPDLIDVLYQPFSFDCRDEEHPDGGPFYTRVMASLRDGTLSLRHNSGYARTSSRFPDCPPLTAEQDELLTLVDDLAARDDIHVDFALEPGDMLLVNNYAIAHARTRFEDHEDDALRRHLLRLWVVLYDGRRLAPDFDNRAGLLTTADVRDAGLGAA